MYISYSEIPLPDALKAISAKQAIKLVAADLLALPDEFKRRRQSPYNEGNYRAALLLAYAFKLGAFADLKWRIWRERIFERWSDLRQADIDCPDAFALQMHEARENLQKRIAKLAGAEFGSEKMIPRTVEDRFASRVSVAFEDAAILLKYGVIEIDGLHVEPYSKSATMETFFSESCDFIASLIDGEASTVTSNPENKDSPQNPITGNAETISYADAAQVTRGALSKHQIRQRAQNPDNGILIGANRRMVKHSFAAWWANEAKKHADGNLPPDEDESDEEVESKMRLSERPRSGRAT